MPSLSLNEDSPFKEVTDGTDTYPAVVGLGGAGVEGAVSPPSFVADDGVSDGGGGSY